MPDGVREADWRYNKLQILNRCRVLRVELLDGISALARTMYLSFRKRRLSVRALLPKTAGDARMCGYSLTFT